MVISEGKKPMKHTAIEQLLEIVQGREESSEQVYITLV